MVIELVRKSSAKLFPGCQKALVLGEKKTTFVRHHHCEKWLRTAKMSTNGILYKQYILRIGFRKESHLNVIS